MALTFSVQTPCTSKHVFFESISEPALRPVPGTRIPQPRWLASQKEQIAAMERYKRDLAKQEAHDKGQGKLMRHRDDIRIERETRKLVAHLRARPLGIDLRSKLSRRGSPLWLALASLLLLTEAESV